VSDDVHMDELSHCISLALTYHLGKRSKDAGRAAFTARLI
jgi:hypothetical protein